jgi:hypothetical protein
MEQKYKVFFIDEKPYLTLDENVSVGDFAVVTVMDEFPSLVECVHDEQIKIFQNALLKSTKRYKLIFKPEQIPFSKEEIDLNTDENKEIVINLENNLPLSIHVS